MKVQVPRGTRDIAPPDSGRWAAIEEQARRILGSYGYREVRTPIFESTELFVRSVGESTDIVRKELYTLTFRDVALAHVASANLRFFGEGGFGSGRRRRGDRRFH
jgi:histidyl-tRNA synthetase